MSFSNCGACSLNAVSVQKNAPEHSGVYGLSNSEEWLLVGEGENIRAMLLDHLKETGTVLKARNPTGFTFELCSPNKRMARQAALVRELKPRCNAPDQTADVRRSFVGREPVRSRG